MSIEQPAPEQLSELKVFQEEIEALKQKEEEEGKTVHLQKIGKFPGIDTKELTDDDRVIWERFQDGSLSRDEFDEYRSRFAMEGGNENCRTLAAFIGNLWMIRIAKDREQLRSAQD